MYQLPRGSEVCTFHEHDRGKALKLSSSQLATNVTHLKLEIYMILILPGDNSGCQVQYGLHFGEEGYWHIHI